MLLEYGEDFVLELGAKSGAAGLGQRVVWPLPLYYGSAFSALELAWRDGLQDCLCHLVPDAPLVVEGLEAIGRLLPFSIRGIDSDNDSTFINERLIRWCNERGIEFTRSRAYRKNDQAWIDQKNGAVVRRFFGYDRYSGPVAGQTMAHLYGAVRLYANYFQPSFKLVEKTWDGARVVKR